tara:strand:- start:251 stop:913 length:663 start_codon:yes stop_codon:yes gene_type:complete
MYARDKTGGCFHYEMDDKEWSKTKFNRNVDHISLLIPWDDKLSAAIWRGSTTGGILSLENWKENQRIQLCMKNKDKLHIDAKITKICQGESEEVRNDIENQLIEKNLCEEGVGMDGQMRYKFLINMDGNGCAWDGMYWKLRSNCVVLHKMNKLQWFYPLLEANIHYVSYEIESLEDTVSHLINNREHCFNLVKHSRQFVKNIVNPEKALEYTVNVLKIVG